MIRISLLAVALLISGCSSTFYTEHDDHVKIHFGGGGHAQSAVKKYKSIASTDKPVVIDGQVISMDAYLAFSLPNACYTENAVFSPHAISYLGLIPSRKYTRRFAGRLPDPLREWFEGNIAYYDPIGWAHVEYEQLRELWPEGECGDNGRRIVAEDTAPVQAAETAPAGAVAGDASASDARAEADAAAGVPGDGSAKARTERAASRPPFCAAPYCAAPLLARPVRSASSRPP